MKWVWRPQAVAGRETASAADSYDVTVALRHEQEQASTEA